MLFHNDLHFKNNVLFLVTFIIRVKPKTTIIDIFERVKISIKSIVTLDARTNLLNIYSCSLCLILVQHPAGHILPSTNVNQSLLSRCSVHNDLLLLHISVTIFDPPAPVLTSGLTLFPTPIPLILTPLTWTPMLLKHFQLLALNCIAPILILFTIHYCLPYSSP